MNRAITKFKNSYHLGGKENFCNCKLIHAIGRSLIIILIMISIPIQQGFAAATPGIIGNIDLHGILVRLTTLLQPITRLILAFSFIAGIAFVFRGVWMLHTFGQMQNQMNRPSGLFSPFTYIIIGTMLIYTPATTKIASATIFDSS